ncbi:MAG: hypothetical protein VB878_15070 [Pirellulaceae bacterium]
MSGLALILALSVPSLEYEFNAQKQELKIQVKDSLISALSGGETLLSVLPVTDQGVQLITVAGVPVAPGTAPVRSSLRQMIELGVKGEIALELSADELRFLRRGGELSFKILNEGRRARRFAFWLKQEPPLGSVAPPLVRDPPNSASTISSRYGTTAPIVSSVGDVGSSSRYGSIGTATQPPANSTTGTYSPTPYGGVDGVPTSEATHPYFTPDLRYAPGIGVLASTTGTDPRAIDPRYTIASRTIDPRTVDPRTVDPPLTDPPLIDPRTIDPRYTIDARTVDPLLTDPLLTVDPRTIDPGTGLNSIATAPRIATTPSYGSPTGLGGVAPQLERQPLINPKVNYSTTPPLTNSATPPSTWRPLDASYAAGTREPREQNPTNTPRYDPYDRRLADPVDRIENPAPNTGYDTARGLGYAPGSVLQPNYGAVPSTTGGHRSLPGGQPTMPSTGRITGGQIVTTPSIHRNAPEIGDRENLGPEIRTASLNPDSVTTGGVSAPTLQPKKTIRNLDQSKPLEDEAKSPAVEEQSPTGSSGYAIACTLLIASNIGLLWVVFTYLNRYRSLLQRMRESGTLLT